MIKEFMLIVYIVGGGDSDHHDGYNYSTNFQYQRFSTMEQCEFVKATSETMQADWIFSTSKKSIPAHYSLKCVELPPGPTQQPTAPLTIPTPPVKRQWDWNETP